MHAQPTSDQPTLTTERLTLRPLDFDDVPTVTRLAGERAVASTTLNIPHPYGEDDARKWIGSHAEDFEAGQSVAWGITLTESGELIGCVSLRLQPEHDRAELGYWIGTPHWGHGYATEACHAALAYGFEARDLARIQAHYLSRNPASGRVMEKLGMKHEGKLRKHIKKSGEMEDIEIRGILREEWEATGSPPD